MRIFGRHTLTWKGDLLYRDGSKVPVATIEQDATHPTMCRVRRPDGSLSDMANRTKAKDAAAAIVLSVLNREESSPGASPMRFPDQGATTLSSLAA